MSLLPPGLHQILQQQVTCGIALGKVDLNWASQIDIERQHRSRHEVKTIIQSLTFRQNYLPRNVDTGSIEEVLARVSKDNLGDYNSQLFT